MKRGGGGRPPKGGRRVLVFAIASAVLMAGGAAAAVAKAGGVSAVIQGFRKALANTNPYPRWQSGPGVRTASPSASPSNAGGT